MNFPVVIFMRLRAHFQTRMVEWLLAAIAYSWGYQLLMKPTIFQVNPIFAEVKNWITQPVLGMFCLMVLGIGRMAVLIINGAWRQSPHLRALMAGIGAFFWAEICIGLSHSGHEPMSVGVYQWFILIEIRTVYTALKDARLADERAKSDTSSEKVVPLRA